MRVPLVEREPKPWELQPGIDSSESWSLFSFFLSLPPPRRVSDVHTAFSGTSYATISRYAKDGLWRARALAWDRHLSKIQSKAYEEVYRQTAAETAKTHIPLINLGKEIVSRELIKLLRESVGTEGVRMKPGDIRRLLESTVKLDRLVRGQATEIVDDNSIDLSQLTPEEFAEYERLARKAVKK